MRKASGPALTSPLADLIMSTSRSGAPLDTAAKRRHGCCADSIVSWPGRDSHRSSYHGSSYGSGSRKRRTSTPAHRRRAPGSRASSPASSPTRGLPAYVPPPMRMEIARLEFTPYIFTRAEIRALLAAGDRLPATARSPRRHLVMRELFRVLYGCGLRISEALKLTVTDVDLDQGVLLAAGGEVSQGPPGRCLAGAQRATAVLCRRASTGRAISATPSSPIETAGTTPSGRCTASFAGYCETAGMSHGGRGRGPRLHDAAPHLCRAPTRGLVSAGSRLSRAKLPVLSAYMGHQSLAGTQRYLRLTPALFPDVVASVEAVVGHAMPRREP